jgi:exopolysaccharide production protein ExoY
MDDLYMLIDASKQSKFRSFSYSRSDIYRGIVKRYMDVLLSIVALTILLPLMGMIYILVHLDGGPGLFIHRRVGRHGRSFGCLKFRTMVVDAENALSSYLASDQAAKEEWEQTRKLKKDPRITRIGNYLRKSSADELPQLWNVLCGEMSIVGPRPITCSELVKYGEFAGTYLSVRPGITGIWQIKGRSDVSYESRVQLDVEYCDNIKISHDILLIIKTFLVVLKRDGVY